MSWSPTINLPIFPSYLFFLHPCLFGHIFDKSFGSFFDLGLFKKSQLLALLLHASSKSPLGQKGYVLSLDFWGPPVLKLLILPEKSAFSEGVISKRGQQITIEGMYHP